MLNIVKSQSPLNYGEPDDYNKQMDDEILHPISTTQNETVKSLFNKTVRNVLQIQEYFKDLDKTIYSSFLFDFSHNYKNNYIDDFNSRLAYDVTRNLGHFERWAFHLCAHPPFESLYWRIVLSDSPCLT